MWIPTHVQVLVRSAKDLKIKGKDGTTNNAFVTIDLGHNRFETSVKPGSKELVEWYEMCEMKLPRNAHSQNLVLTIYHKNLVSTDRFLGMVSIPLNRILDLNHSQKITKCYRLCCKPGQSKTDYRGDLEVGITFIDKSNECSQSLLEEQPLSRLSKDSKFKSSTYSLNPQINTCFKDYSISHGSSGISPINYDFRQLINSQTLKNVSNRHSSLSCEEVEMFLNNVNSINDVEKVDKRKRSNQNGLCSINEFPINTDSSTVIRRKPLKEIHEKLHSLSKDNLIDIIIAFHGKLSTHTKRTLALEEYIDSLILKILERDPEILKNEEAIEAKDEMA